MKRVDLDRTQIERALAREKSMSQAARSLGIATRTLFDRRHALNLPAGQAGRPTKELEYRESRGVGVSAGFGIVVLVGVAALGYWAGRNKVQAITGQTKLYLDGLRGLDVVRSR